MSFYYDITDLRDLRDLKKYYQIYIENYYIHRYSNIIEDLVIELLKEQIGNDTNLDNNDCIINFNIRKIKNIIYIQYYDLNKNQIKYYYIHIFRYNNMFYITKPQYCSLNI